MAVLQDLLQNNTGGGNSEAARNYNVNVTQAPTSVRQAYAEWGISPSSIQAEQQKYAGGYGGSPNADVAIGSQMMRAQQMQPRVDQGMNGGAYAAPSPTASASTSPASNPLYSRISGLLDQQQNQAPAPTYEQMQQQELAGIQDQLNAINASYDQKIADAKVRGEGRQGSTRALNAVQGLAFSPRGTTNAEQTGQFNTQEEAAINADRANEIAAARAAAMGIAFKRSESTADRSAAAANDYIRNLLSSYSTMNEANSSQTNDALAIAKLTGQYGGQDTLALRELLMQNDNQSFNQDIAMRGQTLDEQRYQSDLALKIQAAQLDGKQIVQGDNGAILAIDKYTNQVTNLGNYSKPVAAGGGSGVNLSDPNTRAALNLYFDTFGQFPEKADAANVVARYTSATGGVMSPATNPYQSAREAQLGYKTAKATDTIDSLINSALSPAGQ